MTRRTIVLTLFSVMALGAFSLFRTHQAQTPGPTPEGGTAAPKPTAGESPGKPPSQGIMKSGDRFAGSLALRAKDNQSRQARVAIADWIIYDHQKEKISAEGLLIFHLRAGEVTTIINGQKQDRKEDDFWSVPSGTAIEFETDRDTAAMQVWTVQGP